MSSPLRPRGSGASNAFTLIELLTVIAIIGVLAGITFSVMGGVKERAAIGQARTELATLALALEAYKKQYGDYPQAGNNNAPLDPAEMPEIVYSNSQSLLVGALTGSRGPTMNVVSGKKFIDLTKFTVSQRNYNETVSTIPLVIEPREAYALIDPWGRRYFYAYRKQSTPGDWKKPGYVLFSAGPDGKIKSLSSDPDDVGNVDFEDIKNVDNLYANR